MLSLFGKISANYFLINSAILDVNKLYMKFLYQGGYTLSASLHFVPHPLHPPVQRGFPALVGSGWQSRSTLTVRRVEAAGRAGDFWQLLLAKVAAGAGNG
ncbi:hypothetical protein [Chitinimonas lacunae]|uniref:Uncharacterized protein n=1 Tax=Chitinimonas lacunae TaxID=1963018 RepID=A0ABV8MS54_9NEIS